MNISRYRHLTLIVLVNLAVIAPSASAQTTLFVRAGVPPGGNGQTWAMAYNDLQLALSYASTHPSVTQIWVALGNYRPAAPGGLRIATYQLLNGVTIYGGFQGSETLLSQRDFVQNVTVLNGDLNGNDGPPGSFVNNNENSFHVVNGSGTNSTAALDGFTITNGNANGMGPQGTGGGIYVNAGSPRILNCIISSCTAGTAGGGGIYNSFGSGTSISNCTFRDNYRTALFSTASNVTVRNCTFEDNEGFDSAGAIHNINNTPLIVRCVFQSNASIGPDVNGGAISNANASPNIVNCVFSGNRCTQNGGAMSNVGGTSAPTVTNCVFTGNKAAHLGAAMFCANGATIRNCTFSGNWSTANDGSATPDGGILNNGALSMINSIIRTQGLLVFNGTGTNTLSYCNVEGGFTGTGNISTPPRFMDQDGPDNLAGTSDDDLRLYIASASIDAGDKTALPADSGDLDGDNTVAETLPLDLDLLTRVVDDPSMPDTGLGAAPHLDMGAYEFVLAANTKVWVGGSGSFTSPSNWLPSVPVVADNVVLQRQTTYTVTFPGPQTVNTLAVAAGDVTLDFNGNMFSVTSSFLDAVAVGVVPDLNPILTVTDGPMQSPNMLIHRSLLRGNATIISTLYNFGAMNPGFHSPPDYFDALTVQGNYFQSGTLDSAPASGKLIIDIGGVVPMADHDVLNCGDALNLGGGLVVNLLNGFSPAPGQTFAIVSGASLNGAFSVAFLPELAGDRFLKVSYVGATAKDGGASVVLVVTPVPSPLDFGGLNPVSVDGAPAAAVLVDVDDDTDLDLALAISGTPSTSQGHVIIMLNDGFGVFGAPLPAQPIVGVRPRGITASDFNSDGFNDLAVCNMGATVGNDTVSVLFNDGSGTYTVSSTVVVEEEPTSIAAADFGLSFNLLGVGTDDLVVTNSGSDSVTVLRNTGAGAYSNEPLLPTGGTPVSVDPGDVDNDRNVDLAVVNFSSNNLVVYSNDGTGTFTEAATIDTGVGPLMVQAADLTLDTSDLPELVVISADGTITIALNTSSPGNISFAAPVTLPIGTNPTSLALVNLDDPAQDQDIDIVVVVEDSGGSRVARVLRNDTDCSTTCGPLQFAPAEDLSTSEGAKFVLGGEVTGDSTEDVVIVDSTETSDESAGPAAVNQVSVKPNTSGGPNPACPADVAVPHNSFVNVDDLLSIINHWGRCPAPPSSCPQDIAPAAGNGAVNVDDLLSVINHWGPCPPI